MHVFCPRCERPHDFPLFERQEALLCACGGLVRPGMRLRQRLARAETRLLATEADRVCRMILSPDFEDVDIAIERNRLRELCEELFPDRMELYDMIYESRFDRLWAQFREPESAAGSGEPADRP